MQAILHHELSLLVAGIVLIAIGWNAPNQVGMWTYLVLWGMRQSAKLNLFLGVRNVGVEFLPQHLAYLQSFFRRRGMNALFPLSIAAASALVIVLGRLTLDPGSDPHETSGYALLTAIALLGLLEHGLLMLPIPSDVLWQWGLKSHRRRRGPAASRRRGKIHMTGQPERLFATLPGPAALRRLPESKLELLAAELREFLLGSVSRSGGHLVVGPRRRRTDGRAALRVRHATRPADLGRGPPGLPAQGADRPA